MKQLSLLEPKDELECELSIIRRQSRLPLHITEIQCQWVRAIYYRKSCEGEEDFFELIDGVVDSVFLSDKYHQSRRKEMFYFDLLVDLSGEYNVFGDKDDYVHKYLYV